jgi:5-methyltetrahydropteroyltriglutamate--homocysteine methyltransferase
MPGAAGSGRMTLLWRHPRIAGRPGLNAKKNFMRDPRSLVSPGINLNEGDVSFDGGDLDCGNGLLLLIRRHMDPLERGPLLEFRSTDISVEEDVPAWCRLTGYELVSFTKRGRERSFLVCKGALTERAERSARRRAARASVRGPSRAT